ncbi:MAG: hypothetical protein INQ03_09450 [Candidatus Heimdallarchaeota archaeon]|nr:hypothetical protein [Candidatus Heimdallarchaeota archaeon]
MSYQYCRDHLTKREVIKLFYTPRLPKTRETFWMLGAVLETIDLDKQGFDVSSLEITKADDVVEFCKVNASNFEEIQSELDKIRMVQSSSFVFSSNLSLRCFQRAIDVILVKLN